MKKILSKYIKCQRFRTDHINKENDIRLVLGAAGTAFDSWVSTDIDILDITSATNWRFLFKKDSLNAVLAEHVWEHFDDREIKSALKNCYRYLKKGGYLRIAVPDGFHPDPTYIEFVKPGGTGPGSDTHKQLYNYISLSKLLSEKGFKVELLEYWDKGGRFHHEPWKKRRRVYTAFHEKRQTEYG